MCGLVLRAPLALSSSSSAVNSTSDSSLFSFAPTATWELAMLWTTVALFYITFLFAVARVVYVFFLEAAPPGFSVRKGTHLLIPLPLLSRGLEMSIYSDHYFELSWGEQKPLQTLLSGNFLFPFAIQSLPGYIFLTAYSLNFCFWIWLIVPSLSKQQKRSLTLKLHIVLNIIMYSIWLLLCFLMFIDEGHTTIYHHTEAIFNSTLDITLGTGYVILGCCLCYLLNRNRATVHRMRSKVIRQIIILAAIFSSVFIARGILVLIITFVIGDESESSAIAALKFCYIFMFDLVPAVLIIFATWKPLTEENTRKKEKPLLN
ncbi:hypothetical protein Pelo_2917 [Pelomyxa schiedti]|nr:hypothetical protein Pelo_2917 [Pelomyxa schiedti]